MAHLWGVVHSSICEVWSCENMHQQLQQLLCWWFHVLALQYSFFLMPLHTMPHTHTHRYNIYIYVLYCIVMYCTVLYCIAYSERVVPEEMRRWIATNLMMVCNDVMLPVRSHIRSEVTQCRAAWGQKAGRTQKRCPVVFELGIFTMVKNMVNNG